MPAYMIAYQKIDDPVFEDEYNAGAIALLGKHGGEIVAIGQPIILEGEEPLSDVAAIVRFPNVDAVNAFCNDPEYAPLIALRNRHSKTRMTAIDTSAITT